ncbi:hypothetical protein LINPERHAP2_LOCUS34930 [Linum perenne]
MIYGMQENSSVLFLSTTLLKVNLETRNMHILIKFASHGCLKNQQTEERTMEPVQFFLMEKMIRDRKLELQWNLNGY